jgi:hypothetical protein
MTMLGQLDRMRSAELLRRWIDDPIDAARHRNAQHGQANGKRRDLPRRNKISLATRPDPQFVSKRLQQLLAQED